MKKLLAVFGVQGWLLAVAVGAFAPAAASAITGNYTVSLSTHSVQHDATTTVDASVCATATDAIHFVELGVNYGNISSVTATGWSFAGPPAQYFDATGGTIAAGACGTFHIVFAAGGAQSDDWFMVAGPNSGGSGAVVPTGDLSMVSGTVSSPSPSPSPSASPSPSPSASPSPTPEVVLAAAVTPSDALGTFMQIFETVCISLAALIVPFLVVTWVIRLVSEMVRGK